MQFVLRLLLSFCLVVVAACGGASSLDQGDSSNARDAGDQFTADVSDQLPPGADGLLDSNELISPPSLTLTRLFPTTRNPGERFFGCLFASPLRYQRQNATSLIVADGGGYVTALDPESGAKLWQVRMPTSGGEDPMIVGTPVIVGDLLVVSYHTITKRDPNGQGPNVTDYRHRHRVAVVDLVKHVLHSDFAAFDLMAEKKTVDGNGSVPFLPANNLGRSQLVHGIAPGDTLGRVYITFGNARDLQPWHGWAFELHLDRWKKDGPSAALSASLVTTPETSCGQPGRTGSRDRLCGGGLWAPSGPLLVKTDSSFYLVLAPGNGQLDPLRKDYANTLMRVGPGLDFDPGCDVGKCTPYNHDDPSLSCMESCSKLFIPRIPVGDPPLEGDHGLCDGMTMFQCWERSDYIGGSTPVSFSFGGRNLLAYPTKDGHIYLVDADHLGTMYHRFELAKVCGTKTDPCFMDWAGMIVTQPELTTIDGVPTLVVPTFMPDATHLAGVFGLQVVLEGGSPKFKTLWRYPTDDIEARKRFRQHPSRPRLSVYSPSGEVLSWVVEVKSPTKKGTLFALRVNDGQLRVETELAGSGYRFTRPLVIGDRVYVNSCGSENGPGVLEAYRISH